MSKRIYVGNLPFECDEAALRKVFSSYGTVDEVHITVDRGGRSQGFGFVEMGSPESAATAIKALSGYRLGGNRLKIAKEGPLDRG